MQNEKYRTIAKGNKAFVRNVLPSASAMQLLAAAGFEGDGVRSDLRLTHSNVAILDLVLLVNLFCLYLVLGTDSLCVCSEQTRLSAISAFQR